MQKPTKKELSQVYFLNREIEHDQTRLRELEAFAEGHGTLRRPRTRKTLDQRTGRLILPEYLLAIENVDAM